MIGRTAPAPASNVEEKWTLRYEATTRRLYIIARGFATEQKSKAATETFIELLRTNTVDLVVDLDAMTGYTSEARRTWQECFYPVRRQLRRMLVVGRDIPAIIRMGASVVAAFNGIPIRFFKSFEAMDRATR